MFPAEVLLHDLKSHHSRATTTSRSFCSQNTVPAKLQHARRQGQLQLRRLRGPSLFLGSCCVLVGVIFKLGPLRFGFHPVFDTFFWLLCCLGMFLFLLSLVPTDVRCVPLTAACLGIILSLLIGLYFSWALALHIEMLKLNSCRFLEDDDHDVACSAVAVEASSQVVVIICTIVMSCYFTRALWKRLNAHVLLWSLWRVLSIFFFVLGLNDISRCVARFHSGSTNSQIKLLLNIVVDFLFFAATSRYRFILLLQSWLMSRGQAAAVAAGVAELLGGKEPESVLAHARQTFSCVLASQLTFDDMLESKPNPSLGKKASNALLG